MLTHQIKTVEVETINMNSNFSLPHKDKKITFHTFNKNKKSKNKYGDSRKHISAKKQRRLEEVQLSSKTSFMPKVDTK